LPLKVDREPLLAWIRAAWPELVILIAIAIAFGSTIIGSAHIPYDAEYFHYPQLRTVQTLLSSGSLPLWDSYSYGGIPLLANAQSAWLYPPHLLLDGVLSVIGRPLTEHTLNMLAIAHVALAALGTSWVARSRALGKPAAAFAGVFVVMNGNTVAQAQHMLMTETYGWIPFTILVIDRLARGVTGRRVAALGALVFLMVTAGFLPLAPSVVLLLLGTAIARTEGRRDALVGTVAGIVLGLALTAAMLLPVVASLNAFLPLPLHAAQPTDWLTTAVLPTAVGHWGAQAAFVGIGLTNSYFYIGGAAIFLLPLALGAGRAAAWEAGLVLLLLLATFGGIGQDIANAIQGIKTVGPGWRPELALYVAGVPAALLIARGLTRPPRPRQLAIGAVALLVLVLVPLSDPPVHSLHFLAEAPAKTLIALGLTIACLLAATHLTRAGRGGAGLALAVAAIIACADLAAAVPGRYFVNWPGSATTAGPNATGDGSDVLAFLKRHLQPGERVISDTLHLQAAWAGFTNVWQLPDINGFQPQFSKYLWARFSAATTVSSTTGHTSSGERTFPVVPGEESLFNELDVRYIVMPASQDAFAHARGFQHVFTDDQYHVYRNPASLQRAYGVDQACLRAHGTMAIDRCEQPTPVSVTHTSNASWRLSITGSQGVPLLITGEPWYPGFSASSSRGSLRVTRVGYLAAISVPAGVSAVTLSYLPPGLISGSVVSLLALVVTIILALGSERRRRLRGRFTAARK
jgi:hypothetical protein